MYVIPAIDIIEGKCVRLTQGDYSQKKIYNENPLEVAKEFESLGFEKLHLVDLDGAKAKRIINHKVLEKIATNTALHIDFGGGLKSDEDVKIAFDCGARQITGGTIAVKNPEIFLKWVNNYGSEKIILGADVKNRSIAYNGWQQASDQNIFDFLEKYEKQGIQYVICTDIAKDGMLSGTSVELYKQIRKRFPDLHLIASGGVSSIEDLESAKSIGCYGAIVGKAFYEGKIHAEEVLSIMK